MQPSITLGQKEEIINVVTDTVRKAVGVAIDELQTAGALTKESAQLVLGNGNRLVAAVTATVKQTIAEIAESVTGILKLISTGKEIEIGETDGTETLADAQDVFNYVDSDFSNWNTNVPGKPTTKTKTQIFEMVKDGDFRAIFGGTGRDLDSLCWEQSQIKAFVRSHKKWLRTDGYATLFLFKVGEGKNKHFFVAYVYLCSDGALYVDCSRFEFDDVWYAAHRHRVVLPQLQLES